ncbi:helix-turn-helix domain-containing protein [Pseudonocardia dioxanivorans]|uniref:Transcriptional regulator, CdaR n=1 Tax=Pseudonocardia dioxanivorans (strain ATCC 55486 / DSM 44775 / JCM 13855 / CB1190) TaxID=675635 RepID=F4CKT4_PSEUX|nr:helix-turn-helix domain-containing protein [Pseudonocardia dioxanivorans]AEA23572.1 transcriptional regulator, CdaR [Pseudonocardia dioxanivorans CB1190]
MPSLLNRHVVGAGAGPAERDPSPVEGFLRRLVGADTVGAAAQAAVDVVREVVGAEVSWCGLTEGDVLTMAAHSGLRTAEMPALWRLRVGHGVGGRVAKEGRTISVRDYRRDPRRVPVMKRIIDDEGIRGGVCAPLMTGSEILGVLYATHRVPWDWTDDEVRLVSRVAHDTAVALARIREHQRERSRAEQAERGSRAAARDLEVVRTTVGALVHSEDVGAGLAVLAQHLQMHVELLGPADDLLQAATSGGAAGEPVQLRARVGDDLGTLRVRGHRRPTPAEAALVEVSADLIALQLLRGRAALRGERWVHHEMLDDLLEGRVGDRTGMLARAALLGVDLRVPRYVACIGLRESPGGKGCGAVTREHPQSPFSRVEDGLRRHCPGSVLVPRGGDVVVLLAAGTGDRQQVRRVLTDVVSDPAGEPDGLAAGLGRICVRPDDYADSYAEAALALNLARRRDRHQVVLSVADLGLYGFLVGSSTRQSLEAMVDDALGPLLEADAAGGSEYVKTLDAYLATDRHLERAAASLHVHPNTVRYRLAKVQEALRVNLRDVDDRFVLELALRVKAALARD